MRVIKTHDTTLHGYKYCIADWRGNIIAILPTKESQEREFKEMATASDEMIEVIFKAHSTKF